MVFITDAMYCKYKFEGLKHIMIEANYSDKLMDPNQTTLNNRIKKSHMSIETACEFIKINSGSLETVTLLHLSDRNSNAEEFLKQVKQITGCRVYIAEKNKSIHLEL
jgi:ribonuclease BN (tRNA processing enzyme)